ncbi:MAG: RNA polymerase sigma-70 factor [Gemmatimonadota bacterium]
MSPTRAWREFEELRPHLVSLAYRMVGTAVDAEDLVQDAAMRWLRVEDPSKVVSPRAYLTTIVTRLCINHMKQARVRREEYMGPWLPEPLLTDGTPNPSDTVEQQESLTFAFLLLLQSLSPRERAVLILRDVFDTPYSEVAEMLNTSEANCRQILTRARAQMRARRPRFEVSPEAHRAVMDRFSEATRQGDLDALLQVLAPDAVVISDGGGKARAALNPVHGADRVARFVLGALERLVPPGLASMAREVNGQPGIVASIHDKPVAVLTADVRDGVIQTLYIVTNPDKLAAVAHAARSSEA